MSQEEQPAGLGVDQSTTMHFNTYPVVGKVIRDHEFIRGIFQGPDIFWQQVSIKVYLRRRESPVGTHPLVGVPPNSIAGKIKNEVILLAKDFPNRSGIECLTTLPRLQFLRPAKRDLQIRVTFGGTEQVNL